MIIPMAFSFALYQLRVVKREHKGIDHSSGRPALVELHGGLPLQTGRGCAKV